MNLELISKLKTDPSSVPPIVFGYGEVLVQDVETFRKATRTVATQGIPTTFVTRLRWGEFEWLRRGQVDMKKLLHTEQEYEFFHPIRVGDHLQVTTYVSGWKERRGLVFATIESKVETAGVLQLKSVTTFVLRGAV